jgi:hypothetical protein
MRKWIDLFEQKEEGFTANLYHGSSADFTEFDPSKSAEGGAFGQGFYFSNDLGLAKVYSGDKDPYVAKVTLNNPWVVDLDLDYFSDQRNVQIRVFRKKGSRDRLIADGYDGVLVKQGRYREVVAYYPEQIEMIGRGTKL